MPQRVLIVACAGLAGPVLLLPLLLASLFVLPAIVLALPFLVASLWRGAPAGDRAPARCWRAVDTHPVPSRP